MLLQIVFAGIERGQAPELQDAPITGHCGKLAGGHQLPAQPLDVLAVTFGLAPCAAIRLHGDRGLAQPVFRYFLDSAGLAATEEYHAVHVAEDRFRIFIVNGLALSKLLIEQYKAHLAGTNDGHQLFQPRHLARIGRLVPQDAHMMGQAAPMHIVGPFTQEIEHLRKSESDQKIVGAVRIADAEKCCRPSVTHTVKLHFIVAHNLPELGDVKGSQTSAAGNQNAFGRLAAA